MKLMSKVIMLVKLGTFLPIHRCAVWFLFNLKYISCSYANITLRMESLTLIPSMKIWR